MIGLIGVSTKVNFLKEVSITSNAGEPLALCFLTGVSWWFIPAFYFRVGYVLGIVQRNKQGRVWVRQDRYISLTNDDVAKWQASGHLPKPLPKFESPLINYWHVAATY